MAQEDRSSPSPEASDTTVYMLRCYVCVDDGVRSIWNGSVLEGFCCQLFCSVVYFLIMPDNQNANSGVTEHFGENEWAPQQDSNCPHWLNTSSYGGLHQALGHSCLPGKRHLGAGGLSRTSVHTLNAYFFRVPSGWQAVSWAGQSNQDESSHSLLRVTQTAQPCDKTPVTRIW
jgi:hypothetical protein